MARNPPSFVLLDKEFWSFVDKNCPHPVQSRHRYTWVRKNLTFAYAGVIYERRSATVKGVSGRPVHVITYTGADGSLVEDQQDVQSIASLA